MNEESLKLLKQPMEFTKTLSVTDKWDLCALHFLPLIYPELSNSTVNSYCFSKTKSYFKNVLPEFVQELFIEHYWGQFLGLTEEGKDATSSKRAHS